MAAPSSLNDIIYQALLPVYGPGSLNDLTLRWMIDVDINPYSNEFIREYIVANVPSLAGLQMNQMLLEFFRDHYPLAPAVTYYRLLESGDKRLLESSSFRLLETAP